MRPPPAVKATGTATTAQGWRWEGGFSQEGGYQHLDPSPKCPSCKHFATPIPTLLGWALVRHGRCLHARAPASDFCLPRPVSSSRTASFGAPSSPASHSSSPFPAAPPYVAARWRHVLPAKALWGGGPLPLVPSPTPTMATAIQASTMIFHLEPIFSARVILPGGMGSLRQQRSQSR